MDPYRTPPIGRGPSYTFTGTGPHLVHATQGLLYEGGEAAGSSGADHTMDTLNTRTLGTLWRLSNNGVEKVRIQWNGETLFQGQLRSQLGGAAFYGPNGGILLKRFDLSSNGYQEMEEISAPSAPAADKGRLYLDVSGAKTRLMIIFQSGAAQQIAIEP